MNLVSSKGCAICFKVKKALEKKGITYNTLTLGDADSDRIIKESGLTSMPILEADDGKFYAGNDAYKYVETL